MVINTKNITESLEKKYNIPKEEKKKLDESFIFQVTDEYANPDSWGYDSEEDFKHDVLDNNGKKIIYISETMDGYYNIELEDGTELDYVSDTHIIKSANESLKEGMSGPGLDKVRDLSHIIEEHDLFTDLLQWLPDDQLLRFANDMIIDYDLEAYEDVNEGLDKQQLTESTAGDIIWEKVRDIIREKIESDVIDNLAMVIASEVPEYNPEWCAESSNQSQWSADKLAEELATELMYNLD